MAKRSGVTAPKGFLAAGGHCGVKKGGEPDLALIVSDRPATAAGVFTTNKVQGAPVTVSRNHLRSAAARVIAVNSGNSNTLTKNGIRDAISMAETAAGVIGCKPNQALVSSTGVIGQPLPIEKIEAGIVALAPKLSPMGGADAAKAIMTTDLFPKECSGTLTIGSKKVTVGGCAKGSGMIHPNMATMLAFVATDAAVSKKALRTLVKSANEASFSKVTVDGDTSTSDMLIVMANGASGAPMINEPKGKRYAALLDKVSAVCADLAKMVARDGEGATKFVTVKVTGCATEKAASATAMAIAKSNLVKTALFGQDANWGRILAAAGVSGAPLDINKAVLKVCGVTIFKNGGLASADWESKVAPRLKKKDIVIELDLGLGKACSEVWTCDLSYDYIRINADYRT